MPPSNMGIGYSSTNVGALWYMCISIMDALVEMHVKLPEQKQGRLPGGDGI